MCPASALRFVHSSSHVSAQNSGKTVIMPVIEIMPDICNELWSMLVPLNVHIYAYERCPKEVSLVSLKNSEASVDWCYPLDPTSTSCVPLLRCGGMRSSKKQTKLAKFVLDSIIHGSACGCEHLLPKCLNIMVLHMLHTLMA